MQGRCRFRVTRWASSITAGDDMLSEHIGRAGSRSVWGDALGEQHHGGLGDALAFKTQIVIDKDNVGAFYLRLMC